MVEKFFKRKTRGEIVFNIFNIVLMLSVCFLTIYPIWYVIVHSFNEGKDSVLGGVFWFPRKFTIDNYAAVFKNADIVKAFAVTILRTLIATSISVFFTAMVSYGLTFTKLYGRKLFLTMGTVTMFFGGGLIPTFLLYKNLGILDSFAVYVFPTMFYFYNSIIFMSFFRGIPSALEESAKIDGANEFIIFIRIILPLSKPILATIALFSGVFNWNDYFMGVIYITKPSLQPIQTFLYRVVSEVGASQIVSYVPSSVSGNAITSTSIKLATMVVTTLPIVCVYPFLQKYFAKGVMIGSVKG